MPHAYIPLAIEVFQNQNFWFVIETCIRHYQYHIALKKSLQHPECVWHLEVCYYFLSVCRMVSALHLVLWMWLSSFVESFSNTIKETKQLICFHCTIIYSYHYAASQFQILSDWQKQRWADLEHPLHNSRMLQLASRPCLGALWLTLASDPEEGLSPWPSNPSCWHRGGSASVCWLLGKRNRCVRPHGYKLAERPGVKPRYGLHFEALSTTWATPPQRIQETDLHCVT